MIVSEQLKEEHVATERTQLQISKQMLRYVCIPTSGSPIVTLYMELYLLSNLKYVGLSSLSAPS